ncbi:MAG TPA: hypothetical protein VKS78_15225 [Roseiarcus sp.]|nr:hypothetical protein [Roseiarcus sp.]
MQTHHVANPHRGGHPFPLSKEESEEIHRTLGATPIYVLRQSFGAGFAYGTPGDITVDQALPHMDPSSQAMLVRKLHG